MKILLVDDDPLALEVMGEALAAHPDHHVETCSDGVEALSRVLHGDIPLVISDWMMKCMSGIELCRAIRQADLPSYVYIILVTGRGGVADVVEGLSSGADEFLRKPIGPAELNARVRSIQRLKSLTDEIARQNEQLIEAQQHKNTWINMVVHDLRSPLTAILGYAQLAAGKAPPALQKSLRTIHDEASRVNGMLEQMLAVGKAEDGRLTLSKTLADASSIVATACDSMAPVGAAKQVKIEATYPPDGCMVELDRALIRRVLDNLLSNALRFSPDGSVVEVALHHNGCNLEICVADRGAGVPAFERDRIFEMYATAHERGSRGSRHGLGLAYCRAVVESHGGTIEHRDNAPQGSRFVITIPAGCGSGSAMEAELAADEALG